ncbi:hypothetical protein NVP2275O_053 [Vibrio phage 2.275.O._10N.286.54.E11]|nr:hypothetical protein NVP2275O_053 [Vibrio phage 2.275.O._10N.286.54.E11]
MAYWITPPQYMGTDGSEVPFPVDTTNSKKYPGGKPIGEINYGLSSTCFVTAFHEDAYPNEYPAFHNIVEIDSDEKNAISLEWLNSSDYDSADLLFANATSPNTTSTSVPITYTTDDSEELLTGLILGSNGQVVGTLTVPESNKILFFKVQTTNIPEYAIDRTYYSYSYVKHGSDVYKLRSGISTPYKSTQLYPIPDVWENVGVYSDNTDILERTFALSLNAKSSGDISFITEEFLGVMKLGEYIGEEFNLEVDAVSNTGESISYSIDQSYIAPLDKLPDPIDGSYRCMPPGINLTADGTIIGTPGNTTTTVGVGADGYPIYEGVGSYKFVVAATTTKSGTAYREFELVISNGFVRNNAEVSLVPSRIYEREWFDLISSEAFSDVTLYRPTDPRYGIQRYPKVFVKGNLYGDLGDALVKPLATQNPSDVDSSWYGIRYNDAAWPTSSNPNTTAGYDITNIKQYLIHAFSETKEIDLTVSNIKYKTALDVNGLPLYDVIYKELSIPNRNTEINLDSTVLDQEVLFAISGLKDQLDNILQSNPIEPSDSRYYQDSNESGNYTDSLPLWMVNPDQTVNGAVPGYFAVMPLIYTQPGQGAKFFSAALEQNLLTKFFNKAMTFDSIGIDYTLFPGKRTDYVTLG